MLYKMEDRLQQMTKPGAGVRVCTYCRNLHGHYDAYQVEGTEKKELYGNIRGNLCQAMAGLVFTESEENWEYLIYPGEYEEVKLVNRNLIAVKDESGNYGIINREKDAITDFEYFNVWGDER